MSLIEQYLGKRVIITGTLVEIQNTINVRKKLIKLSPVWVDPNIAMEDYAYILVGIQDLIDAKVGDRLSYEATVDEGGLDFDVMTNTGFQSEGCLLLSSPVLVDHESENPLLVEFIPA